MVWPSMLTAPPTPHLTPQDPLVLGLGFLGWTLPSTIGVSAFGGQSLFGLLTQSIGEQMAHWPTGPALSDKFWLYMITWHIGLFLSLTLAQIGVQGRKQGWVPGAVWGPLGRALRGGSA